MKGFVDFPDHFATFSFLIDFIRYHIFLNQCFAFRSLLAFHALSSFIALLGIIAIHFGGCVDNFVDTHLIMEFAFIHSLLRFEQILKSIISCAKSCDQSTFRFFEACAAVLLD